MCSLRIQNHEFLQEFSWSKLKQDKGVLPQAVSRPKNTEKASFSASFLVLQNSTCVTNSVTRSNLVSYFKVYWCYKKCYRYFYQFYAGYSIIFVVLLACQNYCHNAEKRYDMARRAKGDGTLRKRKDGRWERWFNIGKNENGKIKRKSVTAKTKTECQEKLNKAKEEYFNEQKMLSTHTYLTNSNPTLTEQTQDLR